MARARNIKPGFFLNDLLAEIEPLGRLLFAGLWTIADREGRLEDRPKKIKATVLPYDDCDVDRLLNELEKRDFILRYEVDGEKYIQITNFTKHQNPHYMEVPSELPPPEGEENKFKHKPITKKQRERIYSRDNNKCVLCGSTKNLSIDHIVPISKGGTSEDDNLRTLCKKCNSMKGNRELVELKLNSNQTQIEFKSNSSCNQSEINSPSHADSLNLIPDSLNPIKDMSAEAEPISPQDTSSSNHKKEIQEIMDFYNQQFSECWSSPLKLTKERYKHIRARLKNFNIDDLKKAILNIRASPFHCGENDKGKVYAAPEFLFRNDTQVDKWLKEINMKGGDNHGRSRIYQQPDRKPPTAEDYDEPEYRDLIRASDRKLEKLENLPEVPPDG